MKVQFWGKELEVGGKYFDTNMRDSNDILHDAAALRARLDEDGYLLIRQLRPRDTVLLARRQILEKLQERGDLAPGSDLMEGIVNPDAAFPATTGTRDHQEFRALPAVKGLPRLPEAIGFFSRLLGGPAAPFDYQWVRIARPGSESAIHSDIVFMGRGTHNLYTCWTPLGDVTVDMGPVVLCLGTERAKALRPYWASDVDRDLIEGWLSKDPIEIADRFGGRWATTNFRAGDVLVFSMHILHASLANTSGKFRLSTDARYQLASEPFDERWIGESPMGHYNFWKPGVQLEDVAVSRARWGI